MHQIIKLIRILITIYCLVTGKPCFAENTISPELADSSYTTTITSVPYTGAGFDYGSSQGNSIGYREQHAVPVIVTNYKKSIWVWIKNGNIPANAVVLQYINGYPVFYCRIINGNKLYYGKLFSRNGCLVPDLSNRAYNIYQILIHY